MKYCGVLKKLLVATFPNSLKKVSDDVVSIPDFIKPTTPDDRVVGYKPGLLSTLYHPQLLSLDDVPFNS